MGYHSRSACKGEATSPRLVKSSTPFAIHVHSEDIWGNVTRDVPDLNWKLNIEKQGNNDSNPPVVVHEAAATADGWTNNIFSDVIINKEGDYLINVELRSATGTIASQQTHLTVLSDLSITKVLFGDLPSILMTQLARDPQSITSPTDVKSPV